MALLGTITVRRSSRTRMRAVPKVRARKRRCPPAGPAADPTGTPAEADAPASESSDPSYRALLSVPWLPRILASMLLARIAQSMVSIAIVLFTLTEYHSPSPAGE